ncbi:WAT1-related protein [Striga hermonthica]|uniref:WAT1-related protein n=1 Tax=Striga hermonthica TaxID=68872 RepID=A0A9N7NL02_STRHE|nr:WAT1-related protein [Striga hermonthica]
MKPLTTMSSTFPAIADVSGSSACFRHLLQGREAGAREVAWQDEAPGHTDVRMRRDVRQPVQRPTVAPVAYPLAEIPHGPAPASPNGLHHGVVAGTLFLCGSCVSYAVWFVVQARLAKVFSSKYLATTLTCLVGSLQSLVVGILLGHGRAEWKLKWDLQLLTVVYSVISDNTYHQLPVDLIGSP